MLPADFHVVHGAAAGLIVTCWFGYGSLLAIFARGSLNSQLAVVRRHWMSGATRRAGSPFDAIMLGHIINAVAFFGSATLIVLAGTISLFAGIKAIHTTASELHFVAPSSIELFALEVGFLVFVLAVSFFSFTYALRKLIYAIALVGALPSRAEACPTHDEMVTCATQVLSEAIKSFNFGIRGYYYAVAALCLLMSPLISIIATLVVTSILLYRQLATPTSRAIQDYVEAAKSLDR